MVNHKLAVETNYLPAIGEWNFHRHGSCTLWLLRTLPIFANQTTRQLLQPYVLRSNQHLTCNGSRKCSLQWKTNAIGVAFHCLLITMTMYFHTNGKNKTPDKFRMSTEQCWHWTIPRQQFQCSPDHYRSTYGLLVPSRCESAATMSM